jgi:hypothetical protein
MRREFVALFLSALAVRAFAGELQQIWSPNHSRVLLVDTSGRRDIISIKSGSKIIRLFYGNIGDALDAWKPRLSKLYRIPESQIGKIVLPSFVAAKWISENEVQIDLESSFTETKNFDSFEFTVRALVSGDGRALSTAFQAKADNTETEGSTETQSATVVDPDGWTNLRANACTTSIPY